MRSFQTMMAVVVAAGVLSACGSATEQSRPAYSIQDREKDPVYQEIKQLVRDVSNCFTTEAQSQSIAKEDLDTAAYAVLGRCVAQRQRLKAFQARHDIRSIPQMEAYWAEQDQKDLLFIKQMIAVVRTESRSDFIERRTTSPG